MKILAWAFLIFTSVVFAANEEKNLSILMLNGSSRLHSADLKLNGKELASELADAFQSKNKKNITVENKCESPRRITNEANNEVIRFEDCLLTIKKRRSNSLVIQYQIKSKIKHGKTKSVLRRKMLKASYL